MKGRPRASTPPAVMTYLEIKKSDFYQVETTVDGKRFVTARGWSDLSDMMRPAHGGRPPPGGQGRPLALDLLLQQLGRLRSRLGQLRPHRSQRL